MLIEDKDIFGLAFLPGWVDYAKGSSLSLLHSELVLWPQDYEVKSTQSFRPT